MQPAFHRERIASYAATMTEYADRAAARLDGRRDDRRGAGNDAADARHRRQDAVRRRRRGAGAATSGAALTAVMDSFWMTMLPFFDVLERLPMPAFAEAGRRAPSSTRSSTA